MNRIEICGGIASGKTTLAQIFKDRAIFEDFKGVPFWDKFYSDPERFCFEVEIGFLVQHYHLMRECSHSFNPPVFDFSLLQDAAYADINLRSRRWQAFTNLYEVMTDEICETYTLVHLLCSADELHRRILRRGRSAEATIRKEYIAQLNDAIQSRVDGLDAHISVITVDSEKNNFATDFEAKARVKKLILDVANLSKG